MSHRTPRLIKAACVLTLISLGLMAWAILHPVPLAVIAAMSVGQGIGILGVLLFAIVALRDLRPIFKSRGSVPPGPPKTKPRESEPPPSGEALVDQGGKSSETSAPPSERGTSVD